MLGSPWLTVSSPPWERQAEDPGEPPADRILPGRPRPVRIAEVVGGAYVLLTLTFLLSGLLVVEVVIGSALGDLDVAATRWLARNRIAPVDTATAVLSNLGDTFTVIGVTVGAGTVLLAARLWRQVTVLAVGLPLELAVFLSTTYVVERRRPVIEPLDAVPATASFPSGHMAASIVLYGGLAVIVCSLGTSSTAHRAVWTVAVVLAVGVGFSRVYRGLHHPIDVLAGALLGVGCLVIAVFVTHLVPRSKAGGAP